MNHAGAGVVPLHCAGGKDRGRASGMLQGAHPEPGPSEMSISHAEAAAA